MIGRSGTTGLRWRPCPDGRTRRCFRAPMITACLCASACLPRCRRRHRARRHHLGQRRRGHRRGQGPQRAGHQLPALPRRQRLARRHLQAAGQQALQGVAVPHGRRRPATAPRLRPVVRRAAGPVRHPDHRRQGRSRQGQGRLRLRLRERQGPVPVRQGHQDRGRGQLRRRHARDRRRRLDLHVVRDLGHHRVRARSCTPARAPSGA